LETQPIWKVGPVLISPSFTYRLVSIDTLGLNISSTTASNSADDQLAKEVLELPNGCLCCSVKDTGIASIEKLMEKKGAFDYILLETTGLADPAPIAELFWANEEYGGGLGSQIALDGIVCLVDTVFGLEVCSALHCTCQCTW
jgi:G3E family GTPase